MKKRVVITGLGLVTPAGFTVEENWEKIIKGEISFTDISLLGNSAFPCKLGGYIRESEIHKYIKKRRYNRFLRKDVQLCLIAAAAALEDGKIDFSKVTPTHMGLFMGSGEAETRYNKFFGSLENSRTENGTLSYKKYGALGLQKLYPAFLLEDLYNNGVCYLSIEYGIKGVNNNFSFGASGDVAVGESFKSIQHGELEIALAGGHDSLTCCFENYFLYQATGLFATSPNPAKAMRPYSLSRSGFVPSEGAGLILLETLEHALGRQADIKGEIIGYGCSCDIHNDFLNPDLSGEGLTRAVFQALTDAEITPAHIGYINSIGDATPIGDLSEIKALKRIFQDRINTIPISSIRPIIGHLGAASGPVDLIITTLAVSQGSIPPTVNYVGDDPEFNLDFVPEGYRKQEIDYALSINRGFGGQNSAFIIKCFSTL